MSELLLLDLWKAVDFCWFQPAMVKTRFMEGFPPSEPRSKIFRKLTCGWIKIGPSSLMQPRPPSPWVDWKENRTKQNKTNPPFKKLLLTHRPWKSDQYRQALNNCVYTSQSPNHLENPLAGGIPILYLRKQVQRLDSASGHMAHELGTEGVTHPSWLCVYLGCSLWFSITELFLLPWGKLARIFVTWGHTEKCQMLWLEWKNPPPITFGLSSRFQLTCDRLCTP